MKLSPFDLLKLTNLMPEGAGVSAMDREAWLDNPCTAIYFYLLLSLMRETFDEHLDAKNMNDVCEKRGAYRAICFALGIPARFHVIDHDAITREDTRDFQAKVKELFDGFRDDGDGAGSDDSTERGVAD